MRFVNLSKTMKRISEVFIFTADRYPILRKLTHDQKLVFAITHSVHHMNKSLGKISAECETFDHGEKMDKLALEEATIKMFINVIKLADVLGMSASELSKRSKVLLKRNN